MKDLSLHVLDIAENSVRANASLVEILVIEDSQANQLVLQVKDNGRGMHTEAMRRAADPFFTTKKVGEGTGMGLSVVHGIMESHEGMISAESTPGKGTTFRLYFPVIDETAEQATPASPVHYKGKEKILFVDDEESLVEIGSEMLTLLGYQVTAQTNSLDAYEIFVLQ